MPLPRFRNRKGELDADEIEDLDDAHIDPTSVEMAKAVKDYHPLRAAQTKARPQRCVFADCVLRGCDAGHCERAK